MLIMQLSVSPVPSFIQVEFVFSSGQTLKDKGVVQLCHVFPEKKKKKKKRVRVRLRLRVRVLVRHADFLLSSDLL